MLTDAELLRDQRPAAELKRALLAESIIRLARLRGLGRFRRVGEALAAIAAEQARQGRSPAVPEAMIREDMAEALERLVPPHMTVLDAAGELDAEVDLRPTDAREAARAVLGHLAARGYVIGRAAAGPHSSR